MAGKKAQQNPRRKDKYAKHPPIAEANKLRRLKKHIKNFANDLQAKAKLK